MHRLVADDTVEEKILELHQRKRALASSVIEGVQTPSLTLRTCSSCSAEVGDACPEGQALASAGPRGVCVARSTTCVRVARPTTDLEP